MNKVISKYLFIALLILVSVLWVQHRRMVRLGNERDRYQQNSTALLSEMKRIRLDSATLAVDIHSLSLNVDEYKRFRKEDAEKIRQMGVKLKDLTVAARHEIEVSAPIHAAIMDSTVIRDTIPVIIKSVSVQSPYLQLEGIIESDSLIGHIQLPVKLRQVVWIDYKRRWIFWKKVKGIHQTIISDNPYAEIKYSEYITIQK